VALSMDGQCRIAVESLDIAIAFFVELGLELEERAIIEGDWSGRVTELRDQRVEIAMMAMPDGHGKIELSCFSRQQRFLERIAEAGAESMFAQTRPSGPGLGVAGSAIGTSLEPSSNVVSERDDRERQRPTTQRSAEAASARADEFATMKCRLESLVATIANNNAAVSQVLQRGGVGSSWRPK
jgi:hypothetical protein